MKHQPAGYKTSHPFNQSGDSALLAKTRRGYAEVGEVKKTGAIAPPSKSSSEPDQPPPDVDEKDEDHYQIMPDDPSEPWDVTKSKKVYGEKEFDYPDKNTYDPEENAVGPPTRGL